MAINKDKGFTLLELILVLGIMAVLFSLSVPKIQTTIRNGHIKHIKTTMMTQLYELERLVSESITYQEGYEFSSIQTKNASYLPDDEEFLTFTDSIDGYVEYLIYEVRVENDKYIVSIGYPSVNELYKSIEPEEIDKSYWPDTSSVFQYKDSLGLTWTYYNQADKSLNGTFEEVTLVEVSIKVEGVSP